MCAHDGQVKPIQHKRTLAFLNYFVSHTAGFLNRFSNVCEEVGFSLRVVNLANVTAASLHSELSSVESFRANAHAQKLSEVERRIQRLEVTMLIFENKVRKELPLG
jgi:hypothetical protein